MRYVIKFSKDSSIKFISHLDLMRTIQRVVRRSKLPAEYSQGFNPHMTLSLAQPLSVGIYSEGEYADIAMTEEISEQLIKEKFNEASPEGIKISEVIKVPLIPNMKKVPQVMALIDAADYVIKIRYKNGTDIKSNMEALLKRQSWDTIKKSKSGEKAVDIKPLVKSFNFNVSENLLEIQTMIACGSRENLSPELLGSFVKNNTDGVDENSFTEIFRKDMYAKAEEELVPLYKYFK